MEPNQIPESHTAARFVGRVWISVLACLLTIAVCVSLSVAWLSENLHTEHQGITFKLDAGMLEPFMSDNNQYIAIQDDQLTITDVENKLFLPGASISFHIGLFNANAGEAKLSAFGLEALNVWREGSGSAYTAEGVAGCDEVPMKVGDQYYYLGEQMRFTITGYSVYTGASSTLENGITVITIDTATGTPYEVEGDDGSFPSKMLLTTTTGKQDRVTLLGNDILNVTLQPDEAIVFDVTLEFVATEYDQTEFSGFDMSEDSLEHCTRTIYISIDTTHYLDD